MANTRSHGANARAQDWDDFDEQTRSGRTGSWLPLNGLDEQEYEAGPQLRSMPTTGAFPRQAEQESPKSKIQNPKSKSTPSLAGMQVKAVAVLVGGALAVLAAYAAVSAAVDWTRIKMDDFQYGRPRTSQMDAFVGHSEAEGVPSHFLAMNLNRRVTILEMAGGDSAKLTTIAGPYLFGSGEDLTPVRIAAQDVNADGKPDLIATVKDEQLIYLNDGTAFKLITPEERAALEKSLAVSDPGLGSAEAGK